MKSVSPQELRTLLDEGKAELIDIREPYELEICKIESKHIPMAEVSAKADQLDSSKTCVILCRSGKRAAAVANMLASDFEMEDVAILEGGILAWIEQIDTHLEKY
jgi:rhodanese-related sulfurtransferase